MIWRSLYIYQYSYPDGSWNNVTSEMDRFHALEFVTSLDTGPRQFYAIICARKREICCMYPGCEFKGIPCFRES